MPRKKSKPVDNLAQQMEVLNTPVRKDGVGESSLIQAVVGNQFAEATNKDAIELAMLLQQVIRGQNSLLSKQDEMAEEINKLRGKMDGFDKAAKAWEDDRAGFLERVKERAEDLRIENPEQLAAMRAKAAQDVMREIQAQKADTSISRMRFEQGLNTQEKEMIMSPGRVATVNQGGVIHQVIEPEVIKIKHMSWTLQPGVPQLVPKLVANEFRSRQKIRNDTNERKALLNANVPQENMVVAQRWNDLNRKNGSSGDAFRGDSR